MSFSFKTYKVLVSRVVGDNKNKATHNEDLANDSSKVIDKCPDETDTDESSTEDSTPRKATVLRRKKRRANNIKEAVRISGIFCMEI